MKVEELLENNDVILLDTSVAMSDNFESFVEEVEMPLLESKKKIVVINAVWSELLRHLGSGNQTKSARATKAVEIIGLRNNIFEIEDDGTTAETILRAFADAEFIANIMRAKAKYRQALITNDMKLTRDVSNLNKQESCLGKAVTVYNLTRQGELIHTEDSLIKEEKEKEIVQPVEKEEPVKYDWMPIAGASVTSLTLGLLFGKYGKQILNVLKKVA